MNSERQAPSSSARGHTVIVVVGLILAVGIATIALVVLKRKPIAAVVGDSITVVSSDQIRDALPRYSVQTRAVIGAPVGAMLEAGRELGGLHPELAVINLGSNDTRLSTPFATSTEQLQEMLSYFGDADCIVMVGLNTHMKFGDVDANTHARAINAMIFGLASKDSRIRIADWNAAIERDMETHGGKSTFTDDTVHPNAAGAKAIASLISETTERCGE